MAIGSRPLALALLVFGLGGLGCGRPSRSDRVLVLALDGVDPATIDLLLSEGELPHFARLRREGAYAPLASKKPLLSPVVWTTIATGKNPDQHRIGHFVAINQQTGEQLPVTSQMRGVQAVWNILSNVGRTVSVVGWWATWPAEIVDGSIVSDHLCYHFLFEDGFGKVDENRAGLTYPPELHGDLAPMVRRPADLRPEELAAFVQADKGALARPFDFQDDLSHFRWALATAHTYRDIGLYLWERDEPDVMLVYIEAPDSTSHLFGHLFRAEGLSGELAEQQRRYGSAVEEMYRFTDGLVGEFLEVLDDRTTLMVLSDHGFQLGALHDDPSRTRDLRRVSERYHRDHGILYLYGNRVKPGARLAQPSILDVAPTLLALTGVPPGQDMPGRVLTEGLRLPDVPRVSTHETGGLVAAADRGDPTVDPKILERLESLGYLGTVSSPAGDRNLAAVLFQDGRYQEAAEAYEDLVQDDPEDPALHTSLAGALGALGRHDEAMEHLEVALGLEPLNPEAYHNRAVLHERNGQREQAVTDYRTALRYNPQYEPARQALARLGVSDNPVAPGSDAERLALLLAQRAGEAARSGNYPEAMSLLDEAQRIAPRFALVYQYRSNVAYLMGDRAAAIDALERGMELEPDNALFRENLQRLQSVSP
jgi:tetratricopeptide (TPR) repeat protein